MSTPRDRAAARLAAVRERRGDTLYADFVYLLRELTDCYRDDALLVAPEKLERLQGAASQCQRLADALTQQHEPLDIPKA